MHIRSSKRQVGNFNKDWDVAQSAREIDVLDAGESYACQPFAASNRISGLFAMRGR